MRIIQQASNSPEMIEHRILMNRGDEQIALENGSCSKVQSSTCMPRKDRSFLLHAHGPIINRRDFRTGSMEGDNRDHGVCSWECCSSFTPACLGEAPKVYAAVHLSPSGDPPLPPCPPPHLLAPRSSGWGDEIETSPGRRRGRGEEERGLLQRKMAPQGGF